MSATTSIASSPGGGQGQAGLDKRLLKAAVSGGASSMHAMASQDPSILLGITLQGNTCLHISSMHGHEGFCKDVLGLEESLIKAVNLDGETPLIAAVRNGHGSLASFLLGRHCSVLGSRQAILQQDKYGCNSLHHAIRNGHKDLALELIAAQPDLSKHVNKNGESPMFLAVSRNFAQVYDKLMQIPFSACSGKYGRNCLHAAVANGDQEFAKIIMEKRPELAREYDNRLCTPVTRAVLYGKMEMLRVMLEHDSTLGYEMDGDGFPLLLTAAYRGQVGTARELLKHCPDAPYSTANGQTLLHLAVSSDQAEFVEFVLRTQILRKIINMQDSHGRTALHCAVQKCNPRMVVALLPHVDIDTTVLDNDGDPAAWELSNVSLNAKTLNWNEVAMLMLKANPDEPLLDNLHMHAKQQTTKASRKDAKSLTQTYTSNTSVNACFIHSVGSSPSLVGHFSLCYGSFIAHSH